MTAIRPPAITLVTSRRRLSPSARTLGDELDALEAYLDEAIEAGVDVIQIRERDLDARPLVELTRRVVARAGRTRVIVNERADVALFGGAAGVQVRAGGVRSRLLRALDPRWTIGRSVHEGDDMAGASDETDFLLFGSVFDSASKPGAQAAGLEGLRRVVDAARIPVVAIGGITPARADACVRAGAQGVAAIGLFLPEGRAPDALGVRRAVPALRAVLAASRLAAADESHPR